MDKITLMNNKKKQHLYKLSENRVRRNYLGGFGLDTLRGKQHREDNNKPEDWICSTVLANNKGLETVANEGLSVVTCNGYNEFVADLFQKDPDFFLGEQHTVQFLCKLLDSSMRLHVQAHPTRAFSKQHLGCDFGKFECYYILAVREGISPYIRLGFQHLPTKEEWKDIIVKQDMQRMDACFEKIPVAVGETWFVPGGLPHAIGEGITMLEVMEPTDLVVRCEFSREGVVVPENARFMNKDIDFCLDIFDYTKRSAQEVKKQFQVEPLIKEKNQAFTWLHLLQSHQSGCFAVDKLCVHGYALLPHQNRLTVGIVAKGCVDVCIESSNERICLQPGEAFFVAAAAKEMSFLGTNAEILLVE